MADIYELYNRKVIIIGTGNMVRILLAPLIFESCREEEIENV